MTDALPVLQHQWDLLNDNWADLVTKCGDSQALLARLQEDYSAANANYQRAINKVLDTSDAEVQVLMNHLDTATGKMDQLLNSDAQIADVVDAISDAVSIATSLAAKFTTC